MLRRTFLKVIRFVFYIISLVCPGFFFFFFFFCNCSAYLPFYRGVSIRLIFFPGCLYFCLRFFCLSLSLIFGPIYPCLFFSAWLSLSQFVIIFFFAVSMAISFLCQSIALSVFLYCYLYLGLFFFSDCLLSLTLFKGFLYGCLMFFAVSNYLIFQTVSLSTSVCLYRNAFIYVSFSVISILIFLAVYNYVGLFFSGFSLSLWFSLICMT